MCEVVRVWFTHPAAFTFSNKSFHSSGLDRVSYLEARRGLHGFDDLHGISPVVQLQIVSPVSSCTGESKSGVSDSYSLHRRRQTIFPRSRRNCNDPCGRLDRVRSSKSKHRWVSGQVVGRTIGQDP